MPFLDAAYNPGEQLPDNWGVLLYGKPNSRKTSTLWTMPGHGLVADFPIGEGGTNVLGGFGPRVKVRPMSRWEEIDEMFWFFMNENPKRPTRKELSKGSKDPWPDNDPRWDKVRFDWMACDSITAAQEVGKHQVLHDRAKGVPLDPHKMDWTEYDKWSSIMNETIFKFKTVPGLKVIWVAQERKHDPDDKKGEPEGFIGPDLRDKVLAGTDPSMMLVARCFIHKMSGRMDYRARILPVVEGKYHIIAKSRYPFKLINGDMPPVIRYQDPNSPVQLPLHLGNLLGYTLFGKGEPPEAVPEETVPTIEFEEETPAPTPA